MFVSFEGIEGSGKTTLAAALAEKFRRAGRETIVTREPGATALGKRLRSLLLDPDEAALAPRAELFLFLADRAQHLEEIIRPALRAGKVVLCDRFTDSTLAYQGYGRGMSLDELEYLNNLTIGSTRPDLVFILDLPPETGLARVKTRADANPAVAGEARFDLETLDFHQRARRGFLTLAAKDPRRIKVIDATRSPAELVNECFFYINSRD